MPQKLKKHLSPWIAWSLVVLAAAMAGFAVWACWFQIDTISDNIGNIGIKPVSAPSTTASTAATVDWKTYTNSTYGFQLTFTDSWKGYSIKQSSLAGIGTGVSNPSALYNITVPSTNNKNVMTIAIYTTDAYTQSVAAADPGPGKVLGKTAKYVITYYPANGLYGEPDRTFYNTYIPNLVKTFKAL